MSSRSRLGGVEKLTRLSRSIATNKGIMNSSLEAQMCVVQDLESLILCFGSPFLPRAYHWLGSFLVAKGNEYSQLLHVNLMENTLAKRSNNLNSCHTSLDALSSAK